MTNAGYRNIDAETQPDIAEFERTAWLMHRALAAKLRAQAAELLTLGDAADVLPGRVTWLEGPADAAQKALDQAQLVERQCDAILAGKQRV